VLALGAAAAAVSFAARAENTMSTNDQFWPNEARLHCCTTQVLAVENIVFRQLGERMEISVTVHLITFNRLGDEGPVDGWRDRPAAAPASDRYYRA
jgi:hypothetical protein